MDSSIPFNKPFLVGKELDYIAEAVHGRGISGDGAFTRKCQALLQDRFGVGKAIMTPSCTAALEMAAMLCPLGPGDEAITPSFTFVSTASAIARTGAAPVFVDIRPDTLNLDPALIEQAITPRTKAIFPVHYAGVGCEMDAIMQIAKKHNLRVVEDAAQGVNAFYRQRALGSIGDLGAYSFHETKNYICGEGGALCINDPELIERAEILRDKGTNRSQFFRGQVDKYTWVDLGSSYAISEICCAFLYAQLEQLESISKRRRRIYQTYEDLLAPLAAKEWLQTPLPPESRQSNYHMFYILLPDGAARDSLLRHMQSNDVSAVFHYVPLHSSPMGEKYGFHKGDLPITEQISERLLRLPFYYEITLEQQQRVVDLIEGFFQGHRSPAAHEKIDVKPSLE